MTTSHHTDVAHAPAGVIAPDVITADLVSVTSARSGTFKLTAIILGVLAVVGIAAIVLKLIQYSDDTTRWGYVAAAMAFLLTVAGGAPMVAIAPVLAKANWVRAATRAAAMFSAMGVMTTILLIPLLFMLPPLVVDGIRRRSIWFQGPDYSPHIWDTIGLVGLLITGLALFYSAAIPDFAVMRDHATGWRQRWGARMARGWVGTDAQWRTLRMRIGMFGTLYFLILVFVHFLISSDFGQSMVPGWRDAIFPMYHTITSFQGGVAAVVLALWAARRWGRLGEYIHLDQFWALGRLLFALTLLWFYFFFSAFIVYWYGRAGADVMWLDLLVRGPYRWAFVTSVFLVFFAPWWWLIWNRVRTSVNGPAIGAVMILFGLMLDRVRLYVAAWSVPTERLGERFLTEIPPTIWPDLWDYLIIIGGIAGAILLYMLMTRLVPIVSVWEVQQSQLLSKPVRFIRGHGVLVAKPD